MKTRGEWFQCAVLFLLACLSWGSASLAMAAPHDVVWVEGEAPSSVTPDSIKPDITDTGRPAYLSGGKWLRISLEAADVDKQVPDSSGITVTYSVTVPRAATYSVWNRIGYEKVRSPFDWRLDNGDWHTVTPEQNTVDVEELQTWNPVGWLSMGAQALSAGAHTLQIRLTKTKDDKGGTGKLLYASDALCLTDGDFHPNGPLKPGDTAWESEADKAAAAQVFSVPPPTSAAQTSVSLKGDWQTTADDELTVTDRTGPIPALPNGEDYAWRAIPIPSDRNQSLPEMAYVHRYWLRTRVHLPAEAAGHSFFLHIPSENLIATVFVNGQQCGWTKTPFAAWDCDITRTVKTGADNEIWVGIKDPFYALADAGDVGHPQYIPYDFWHYNTTNQLDFPILSHYQTGILHEPTLVVAGKAYTSDVFAIPSVKTKTLGLEVTVSNPTDQPITVSVGNAVFPAFTPVHGAPALSFPSQQVTVPAAGSQTVKLSAPWPSPKLWWPDAPNQYEAETTLSVGGQVIDSRTTKFGFREWGWQGAQFTLNGVPWHGRADLVDYSTDDPEAAVKTWRAHGQTMERLWTEDGWGGMDVEGALDFFDAHGVPIRRTGIFDGEGAAGFYNLTEQVNGKTQARKALFDNWRAQLAAWVKGQRNHPSIFIWSMENEITFINSKVFGNNPYTDPEMTKAAAMLAALDPTRPQMTDGGNALLDQSLPVYGGHYMEPSLTSLPEGAYDLAAFAHRQIWPITEVKPILLGEAFYANGIDPAQLATVGGEAAFVGKAESHPAVGLAARMLSEGYRWNGVNFHFWFGGETDAHYIAWQPVAVLCRQWDATFGAGRKIPRTLGIFNDTHTALPISLTWTLVFGGKTVAHQTSLHPVAAGENEKFNVTLPMPAVAVREDGQWTLALSVQGKPVFKDVKAVSVLPVSPGVKCQAASLAVYDPSGAVPTFLYGRGMAFTSIKSLGALPPSARVLVVGKDALDVPTSTSSRLAAYASAGRTVIVLEQRNPLRYQGLPGEMAADTNAGDIAFAEDLGSPVLKGLAQRDFFAWGPDGLLYRDAYAKPKSGGKSLVECSDGLQDTALAEMTAGKGLLLLSQLLIGEKLTTNVVAQTLLLNMIDYGQRYRQTFRPVSVAAGDNAPLTKALDAMGLRSAKAAHPLQAIEKPGSIAVIDASSANLHALAGHLAQVRAFTQGGGWIVLNGLTPAGLADYNTLVGVEHLIRPFGQEKVTFPPLRNPLTAGLAASNIVMGSGKQILNFAAGQYPDTDAYGYVVDYDDVAPFATSPFFAFDKIVNDYTMADGFWPLIINFKAPKDGSPYDVPLSLPRPEKITQFTWVSDTNYAGVTRVNLVIGGKTLSFPTQPNGDPQTFAVAAPQAAKSLTLQIADWQHLPSKQQDGQDLVGIDNITLKAYRSPEFYRKVKPMLNIGAMMEYPQGKGGIVLCNVKFQDTEAVPENAVKKQTILATILRNLQAPFSGGKTVIAGANLTYAPLDISKQANQYRGEQGWFGDKSFTFADLPTGKQTFDGVTYRVYDFTTSPVPTVVMLGGPGIPGNLPDHVDGIPVGRKADALFFLQSARLDRRRSPDDVKKGKQYEMADYVIHYSDGQTVKVPVYAEVDVDDYKQKMPTALPGAQIAWTKPYPGTGYSAVAYTMQWNNPRPQVPIQSIDLVYGPDRRGVPVLLALTAATTLP